MSNSLSNVRVLLTTVIVLGVSACATPIKSSFDVAESVDIGQFKTYAWIGEEASAQADATASILVNPINQRRVRISIDQELERKGYVKVPLAQADLAIASSVGAKERIRVVNHYNNIGYGYYGFHRGFSRFGSRVRGFGLSSRYGGFNSSVKSFTEGTLVVDVFDNKQKEALWHGAARKRIARDDNGRELISEAVGTLFDQFPDRAIMNDVMMQLKAT